MSSENHVPDGISYALLWLTIISVVLFFYFLPFLTAVCASVILSFLILGVYEGIVPRWNKRFHETCHNCGTRDANRQIIKCRAKCGNAMCEQCKDWYVVEGCSFCSDECSKSNKKCLTCGNKISWNDWQRHCRSELCSFPEKRFFCATCMDPTANNGFCSEICRLNQMDRRERKGEQIRRRQTTCAVCGKKNMPNLISCGYWQCSNHFCGSCAVNGSYCSMKCFYDETD